MRLIRRGDTGPPVVDVQQRLSRALGEGITADGAFGDRTHEAVRRFQRERHLPADGIVGAETWRALVESGYTLGSRLLWHSRRMMRGDDVRELQHRLNQLGFDAAAEDGIFGPLARAAVEEFQRNTGLAVDGVAGPQTIAALRRLLRGHQSGGVGVRAREREWLRGLSGRTLSGARILVDPSHGPGDPGHVGASGLTEADVAWAVCSRLHARLAARGAAVVLSRGPGSNPTGSERARLANEQGVDVTISIGVNALDVPQACGSATYFFGAPQFSSEGGYRLATLVQDRMALDGWHPDCRVHPMTWAILRETRMPAIVAEPGFISSPRDEERLGDAAWQNSLADSLVEALALFFEGDAQGATAVAG
ncbi:MAG: N-acetylmuramoyl-L-alanine amidase [Nitriliruptorales bacterium]|nr:N-acetylmuramoyl-L-alanine amidase [Nitriliruptorales bacterium]